MEGEESLTDLLRKLHCSSSSFSQQLRKKVEERQALPNFTSEIIVVVSNTQLEDNVRVAGCTYLKKIATKLQDGTLEEKASFMRNMLVLLSCQLQLKLKKIILGVMEVLLFRKDPQNQLRAGFFELVKAQVVLPHAPLNLLRCECLALCGQLLMVMRYDQLTFNLIDKMLEGYLDMLAELGRTIHNIAVLGDNPLASQLPKIVEVGVELTSMFKTCFRHDDLPRNQVFERMLHSQHVFDTLNGILQLQLPCNILPVSIIQVAENKEAQSLNTMKSHIIGCLEVFLRCSIFTVKRTDRTVNHPPYSNPFIANAQMFFRNFIQSMMVVFSRVRPDQIIGTSVLKCAHQMLVCLSVLVELPDQYDMFSNHREDCLNGFLLFFFDIGKNLHKQFRSEPEMFIDYIYQMTERTHDYRLNTLQKDPDGSVLHIVAARLLMRMCIYIDGLLKTVIDGCLELLEGSTNFSEKQRALVILGVVSMKATERSDQVHRIYEYFQTAMACSSAGASEDEKIYSCLQFLVISKYLAAFHKIDQGFRTDMLRVSIEVLRGNYPPAHDNPAIDIVNLSLLDSMFQLSHNDHSLMEEVLTCLIELVRNGTTSSKHLYAAMLQLIKDYEQLYQRPQLLKHCVQVLVEKICNMVGNVNLKERQSRNDQVITLSCWSILRQIISSRRLTFELIVDLQLEIELEKTFKYLQEPKSIEYDDDLLIIFVRFAQLGRVSEVGLFLINYFGKLLSKYRGSFHNIYPLTMLLLVGGRNFILDQRQYLKLVFDACRTMLSKHHDRYYAESQQAKALLLLMCVVSEFSEVLELQFWHGIIQFLMQRLNNTEDISRCFLQECIAALLVLCVAYGYPHIQNQAWLPDVIDMVLAECRKVEKNFPRRIFSISLSKLLRLATAGSAIEANFLHLFYLCVTMVTNEKVLKRLKRRSSADIEEQAADSDDLSDEEDVYVQSTEMFNCSLSKINEFEFCKQTLEWLKKNHITAFNTINQQLDEETKQKVKTIMRVKMMQNGPREIVKIRRN